MIYIYIYISQILPWNIFQSSICSKHFGINYVTYHHKYKYLGLSYRVVKRAIGDWMERKHIECWKSSIDCKLSKALMEGPQQSKAKELQGMSRLQLSVVVALLTGHCHLHRIGKDINPLCRRCLNANETVEHLLCECETLAIAFLDKVLESFNNSHMSQWIYFDGLPYK